MTYLQLVNRVLRRLREDAVTDLTSDYALLIGDFLAETHGEILEAHDWSMFDTEVTVSLVDATAEYDLATVLRDSTLRYNGDSPTVSWFESPSATQGQPLWQMSWPEYQRFLNMDTSQAGNPVAFSLRQDGDTWTVAVWPTPNSTGGEVRMLWNIPEAVLDVDNDADSREVLAPSRPLILGALFLALNERGEEIGEPGNMAETRYYSALLTAKETDILNNSRTNRYEFQRV